jgi:hypothetical protein
MPSILSTIYKRLTQPSPLKVAVNEALADGKITTDEAQKLGGMLAKKYVSDMNIDDRRSLQEWGRMSFSHSYVKSRFGEALSAEKFEPGALWAFREASGNKRDPHLLYYQVAVPLLQEQGRSDVIVDRDLMQKALDRLDGLVETAKKLNQPISQETIGFTLRALRIGSYYDGDLLTGYKKGTRPEQWAAQLSDGAKKLIDQRWANWLLANPGKEAELPLPSAAGRVPAVGNAAATSSPYYETPPKF